MKVKDQRSAAVLRQREDIVRSKKQHVWLLEWLRNIFSGTKRRGLSVTAELLVGITDVARISSVMTNCDGYDSSGCDQVLSCSRIDLAHVNVTTFTRRISKLHS